MSTQTRERLEQAAAEMQRAYDEINAKSDQSVEDVNKLLSHGAEVDRLQQAHKASEAAGKTLDTASRYIAELADAPTGTVKSANDPGLIAPNGQPASLFPGTKSIGEAWIESQQFKALDTIKVGGAIPESRSFQTDSWHFDQKDQKALLTGSSTSAGAAVFNDIHRPITDLVGYRELTVADLVTHGQTTSDAIDYVTVTARTNNAGMFAETTNVTSSALKPESSLTLAVQTVNVRTIAHWIPITRRAAADAPQVVTLVNAFLRRGLEEKLEDQILNGAGTGEEFQGIIGVTGIQTQDATVGGGGNVFDSMALAISKVRYTAFRRPTAIVVNPLDWYSTDLLLKKEGTSLNSYVFANPGGGFDQNQSLWGLPVVITPAIAQNTALVGDFRQAILWMREGISMYMTDSHSDFFVRNVLVILMEMRAALGILDPRSFVKVTNV